MNERIWEIWCTDVHSFARRQQLVDQEVIEKFGELIVAECISACATDRLGKTVGAEELIREHFGVE